MDTASQNFLQQHQLTDAYLQCAEKNFGALLSAICTKKVSGETLLVGINGSQGSGKSTLADYLVLQLAKQGCSALAISLDDFYLRQAARNALAQQVHPLLKTRGVPGTHELQLAIDTLQALKSQQTTSIPRFDKANDDRYAQTTLVNAVDVVIFEGWCLGLVPQSEEQLQVAINALEAEEDSDAVWRMFVNQQLADYQALFKQIDILAMLKAPSFDCVAQWRIEQEQKLSQRSSGSKIMSAAEIHRFVQFFQRLTEHSLATLPDSADFVYCMDASRQIIQFQQNTATQLSDAQSAGLE
ncbi:MAG: kinase [Pseudomonadales bacterium]|nr:kinase [Pseudomonadales bacterium]